VILQIFHKIFIHGSGLVQNYNEEENIKCFSFVLSHLEVVFRSKVETGSAEWVAGSLG
jgi:hypothetical protein